MEVEVVPLGNGKFSLDGGLKVTPLPPQSMSLSRTAVVGEQCTCVCQYKGVTYVGLWGGKVDTVNEFSKISKPFVSLPGDVSDLTIHNNKIYSLVFSKGKVFFKDTWTMYVHELSGEQCNSWTHTDTDSLWVNQFTIVDNQIVIPHRREKKLVIYSLTGKVAKRLPCPRISDCDTRICAVDESSVIVSNLDSSWVGRVDISTGGIMWSHNRITSPRAVVCYRRKYALLTSSSQTITKIHVLNIETGESLNQITDTNVGELACVFDLHISGDTLIVPRCEEKKVLFYKLGR